MMTNQPSLPQQPADPGKPPVAPMPAHKAPSVPTWGLGGWSQHEKVIAKAIGANRWQLVRWDALFTVLILFGGIVATVAGLMWGLALLVALFAMLSSSIAAAYGLIYREIAENRVAIRAASCAMRLAKAASDEPEQRRQLEAFAYAMARFGWGADGGKEICNLVESLPSAQRT
jgi:hypothetical protein